MLALLLLAGAAVIGSGCSLVSKEFEKDKRNPDNVTVDKTREAEQRREAQNKEPRDCRYFAVLAYDQAGELLAQVDADLAHRDRLPAGDGLRRAEKITAEALLRIERDRNSGVFRPGLKYGTAADGLLEEAAFLSRLQKMHDEADRRFRDTVGPQVMAETRKKFGAKSSEQVQVLVEEGRPTRQERGPRGEHCWIYVGERQRVTYCWDGRGMLLRRGVSEDETAAVATPPRLKADACPEVREKEARERQAKERKEAQEREAREAAARKCAEDRTSCP